MNHRHRAQLAPPGATHHPLQGGRSELQEGSAREGRHRRETGGPRPSPAHRRRRGFGGKQAGAALLTHGPRNKPALARGKGQEPKQWPRRRSLRPDPSLPPRPNRGPNPVSTNPPPLLPPRNDGRGLARFVGLRSRLRGAWRFRPLSHRSSPSPFRSTDTPAHRTLKLLGSTQTGAAVNLQVQTPDER